MSESFKAFVYDVFTDRRHWAEFTRATLIDEAVKRALWRHIGPLVGERFSAGKLTRLVLDDVARDPGSKANRDLVLDVRREWNAWWRENGSSAFVGEFRPLQIESRQ